ncbi:uncharacterized protein At4g00950-like isoform X2 [Salvia miltiorrhiza]|uniref:uncharacterized protein At4g00950-like isoform X2 n=1 Tax=Salvia miltiorrhiza TaxID=226208 RepID=UPI0025AC838E|nr:uncharacterized protein At4g00950-like isoform X2 [Salvia miltiorrhiza]
MGIKLEDHHRPTLTLSKLPYCKPREPPQPMQTPPLRPSASIPFHWEEAPGKPRAGGSPCSKSKSKSARCLELPPRLVHEEAKMTMTLMTPSPTTVLDGPYVGRSLSLACTFSFRKGPVPDGKRNLGSGRWGSERKLGRGSMDFSQSLGDIFRSEDNLKLRRRRSFFGLSTINSKYLWGDIYASFKQAVSWRRSP